MKSAQLGSAAVVIAGIALTGAFEMARAQAQAPATGAGWAAPRTAWGDPDLPGKWAVAETGTPMERPAALGNREFLTEQEVVDRAAAVGKQAAPEDADAPVQRQQQPEHERGIRGEEYNRFWVDGPKVIRP